MGDPPVARGADALSAGFAREAEPGVEIQHEPGVRPGVVELEPPAAHAELLDQQVEAGARRAPGGRAARGRCQPVEVAGAAGPEHDVRERPGDLEPAHEEPALQQGEQVEIEVDRLRAQRGAGREAAGLGERRAADGEPHRRPERELRALEARLAPQRAAELRLHQRAHARGREGHRERHPRDRDQRDRTRQRDDEWAPQAGHR